MRRLPSIGRTRVSLSQKRAARRTTVRRSNSVWMLCLLDAINSSWRGTAVPAARLTFRRKTASPLVDAHTERVGYATPTRLFLYIDPTWAGKARPRPIPYWPPGIGSRASPRRRASRPFESALIVVAQTASGLARVGPEATHLHLTNAPFAWWRTKRYSRVSGVQISVSSSTLPRGKSLSCKRPRILWTN